MVWDENMANRWGKEHKFSWWLHPGPASAHVPWDENRTFSWKLSPWSFFVRQMILCCQLLHWKGSFWYHFSHFPAALCSRSHCLWPRPCRVAPNVSVNGEIRQLPWTLPALEAAAVRLQHINAMQQESNKSHSGFEIINIWLKSIGLDGYKPRAEFHAKLTQKVWIIALCCNLGTDSIQEGNSFWCREWQFYSRLNFLLKSPGNYLSVRHALTIQFF